MTELSRIDAAVQALYGAFRAHGFKIRSFPGTDVFGIVVTSARILPEVELTAQRISQKIGGLSPIKVASRLTGWTLVGFSARPEFDRTPIAAQGFRVERLDVVRPYGRQPLYGGAWTCAGASCLTLKGS